MFAKEGKYGLNGAENCQLNLRSTIERLSNNISEMLLEIVTEWKAYHL